MTGVELILSEREQQLINGQTAEYDAVFNKWEQLMKAVEMLIQKNVPRPTTLFKPSGWNEEAWTRLTEKPYKERLIIAGSLLAAEYDRLKLIGQ